MYRNCQVCGSPIFSVKDYGTDSDGRLNRDYCSNCYKDGHFYSRDTRNLSDEGIPYAGLFAAGTNPGVAGVSGVSDMMGTTGVTGATGAALAAVAVGLGNLDGSESFNSLFYY